MSEWWKHYAGSVAFVTVLVVGSVLTAIAIHASSGAGHSAYDAKRAAHSARSFAQHGLHETVRALFINCRQDHRFRVRYKERGKAVTVLLRVEANEEPAHARHVLLRGLSKRTKPIPIPDCKQNNRQLRRALLHG